MVKPVFLLKHKASKMAAIRDGNMPLIKKTNHNFGLSLHEGDE